jgi:DNA-binding LytR/AlgR family response regulator
VGEFEDALKAESFLKQHQADILFLDIEMPRLSSLEYLRNCKVKPLVIITTAYPEYALEGYALDVVDYLLKPIAFNRFFKAAEKAREVIMLRSNNKPDSDILFVRCTRKRFGSNTVDLILR